MDNQNKYGLKRAKVVISTRDLIVVPHLGGDLSVGVFGSNSYSANLAQMQGSYFHSKELPQVSFREPKTPESISATAYGFGENKKGEFDAKRDIFDPSWLQAGRIVRTQQGVIVNPILDTQGNVVLNQGDLEAIKRNTRKIQVGNGYIYLGDNDFGFAEYETFKTGVQDSVAFVEGGLARIIEHTEGPAVHLKAISSKQNYPRGVNVWGFETPSEPIERVLSLGSYRGLDSDRLDIGGNGWIGYDGFAFGVRQ